MILSFVSRDQFVNLIVDGRAIIDVRAPVEFAQGALPNSVNLPILDDEERRLIGTCYKQHGPEKAVALGYKIVSGENKEHKIKKWRDFISAHPQATITCFRGGLRSQITQSFLREAGLTVPRIEKGYKQLRQYLSENLDQYAREKIFRVLTGNTGSAKTRLIQGVKNFYPCVDLEDLAKHRGSAFGKRRDFAQPAQASFENLLATEIIKNSRLSERPILYEDESRVIGSVHLPEVFFDKLRDSKVIKVQVPLSERVENIFIDYILEPRLQNEDEARRLFTGFRDAVGGIRKKLGDQRAGEILQDMRAAEDDFLSHRGLDLNRIWIEKLLVWYYDPLYEYSFNKRNPLIEFQGVTREIHDYLKNI